MTRPADSDPQAGVRGIADEALRDACDWAREQGDSPVLEEVVVQCKAHFKNTPSLALLSRHGEFEYVLDDGGYQGWEAEFDVSSPSVAQ